MKLGTKFVVIHELSGYREAFRVIWAAGPRWHGRPIRESDLGEFYMVYRIQD
jgi:hypothetical protein